MSSSFREILSLSFLDVNYVRNVNINDVHEGKYDVYIGVWGEMLSQSVVKCSEKYGGQGYVHGTCVHFGENE